MVKPEALLGAILAGVDEGIHVVDAAGVTIYYNEAAGAYDGLHPDEVVGRHLLEVFPSLDAGSSTLLRVLETGQPLVNVQQTFTNYKGYRVSTINSTWPVYEGARLVGALEVSKDVTRVWELSERVVELQAQLLAASRDKQPGKRQTSPARFTFADLVGQDPAFLAVLEQARRAALGPSPILVGGETGTGKELLVQAIHNASPRGQGPFIAQNCAALPEGLLEGLLFGTKRGGFTGAEDRPGLFALADRGTLFLDEINSMPLALQAKLLRVLQDGRIRRVGDTQEQPVDVRVIASTNEPPLALVQQGRLRQDLFFRINVVYLELPPLRERPADILLLARHFVEKYRHLAPVARDLSPAVLRFFKEYPWPGNVRELEHAVQAGLSLAGGPLVDLADLPAHMLAGRGGRWSGPVLPAAPAAIAEEPAPLRDQVQQVTERAIREAMAQAKGNVSQAARLLGLPRQTLQYRLRKMSRG
jgi:arginine utilization regulatory protein